MSDEVAGAPGVEGEGPAAPAAGPEAPSAPSAEAAAAEPQAPAAPANPPIPEAPAAPAVPVVRRQSIVTRSGACDMRVGAGATDSLGQSLKSVVGKPRRVLLVQAADVAEGLVERVRRTLADVGFDVRARELPGGRASRNLATASSLMGSLAEEGVTADDAVVVVGDADLISLAVFVASTWCGGCVLAAVPTTLDGMVDVTVTPRMLDVGEAPERLLARGNVRLAVCDPDNLTDPSAPADEGTLMGRAVMVAGGVAAGSQTFNELAVRADALLAGDAEATVDEVLEMTKSRCRVASSSALAVRQGVTYGQDIARALGRLVDAAPSRLLGEGLRIAARLAVAHSPADEHLVDFVFVQDGLLEKLGLDEVPCDVDPEALLAALRDVAYERANRFMPALPLDYGRVRLTSIEDETLSEHVHAWCRARRRLKRKLARAAERAAEGAPAPQPGAEAQDDPKE